MALLFKANTESPLTKCPNCGYELYLAKDLSYDAECPICGTLVRKKTRDRDFKAGKSDNSERYFVSFVYGFFLSAIVAIAFRLPSVTYVKDGFCDVCGAPANYIAYAGYNADSLKPVNEFCFFHSIQWGISQLVTSNTPFEILIIILIIFLLIWISCGFIVYKIFGWWHGLD
jgi:predicted RNA-binding Zn-ribbon protein involved in translation (DUF1610 family)